MLMIPTIHWELLDFLLFLTTAIVVVAFALDAVGGWSEAWATYAEQKGASATLLPSQEALGSSYWQCTFFNNDFIMF